VTKRKTTMHAITIPAIPPPERPVEKSSCSMSATQKAVTYKVSLF
jgi:hypothetical protein